MSVTLDSNVEVLVDEYPDAIGFLADRGILCVVCGEAYWGTLGQLMSQKQIDPDEQRAIVDGLNTHLEGETAKT